LKKYYYIFIFFVCTLSLYSQKTDINPNGYNKFYYDNGNISSEGMMKNGKPVGVWKTYYENGIIKSEGQRKNFILDSIWVFYNNTGDTLKKINYRNDKKNGYYITYKYEFDSDSNKVGGIISKELFLDDIKQGKSLYYTLDGYLDKTIMYVNNKKKGISKGYAKDGRLIAIIEYTNDVLINKELINRYNKAKLKQGIWKEFYNNDKIKTEANYINGKIHGLFKEYSISGNLIKVLKYEYGKLMIDSLDTVTVSNRVNKDLFKKLKEEYYPNGALKYLGAYNDSVPVGLHKAYSENGKTINAKKFDDYGNLIAEGTYNEKGRKHGTWKYYYNTGELKSKGRYNNNRKDGKWIYYFLNGKVEQKGSYIKGKFDGKWIWYYENSQIEREENYDRGIENGLFVEYDEIGNIMLKGEYIDGEREGFWFYDVGDHKEEGNYQFGLFEGEWKHYYSNGKLLFIGKYVQGSANGKHKYYYDNGKLKSEGRFMMDSKEGNWDYYNYEGELFLTIRYKNNLETRLNGKKIKLSKE